MQNNTTQFLVWSARLLMLLTLVLMAWSVSRGLGRDAFYQFILGASVVLLLRRWYEGKGPANG